MANSTASNFARKLLMMFLKGFESSRVLTKTIDTQLFQGKLNPESGTIIDVKRPHDYNAIETSGGDISGSTKSDIISGKASATVQNYITVATEWSNIEEALELNQLEKIIAPMGTRAITTLEKNLGVFMLKNSGLLSGTVGTAVTKWSEVANAGALLSATGVPNDMPWYYIINPFTMTSLADVQNALASGRTNLVTTAWEDAQISRNFGGLKAIQSNALATRVVTTAADLAGTLTATPTATYVSVKDTMTQTLAVTAFTAAAVVKAGDIVQITGRNRLNLSTRDLILDETGAAILWTAVVTADVTLGGSGEGDLVVTGPAIRETDGQYNSVDTALTSGDVITILGTSAATIQPNLFYHPQAFTLATVKLPKLFATDETVTTEDGFSIRVTRYSDGDANVQKIRFDLLPAFGQMNPFFAGQGFGTP